MINPMHVLRLVSIEARNLDLTQTMLGGDEGFMKGMLDRRLIVNMLERHGISWRIRDDGYLEFVVLDEAGKRKAIDELYKNKEITEKMEDIDLRERA